MNGTFLGRLLSGVYELTPPPLGYHARLREYTKRKRSDIMSTASNKHETTIAVIGGGIGGILTAIGLGKHGYNVHLFEQAPKFSEIGAGIAM